jgi:hypothetical protein
MEMEIAAAADHGVNVFIYDWYWYDHRPFPEQCLDNGFLRAGNRDRMKFYLMLVNHDAMLLWDERNSHDNNTVVWDGGVTRAEFERALRMAKAYADSHQEQPPLITVNSWNEWTETSYLEPDGLYGHDYLEAVRRVFLSE